MDYSLLTLEILTAAAGFALLAAGLLLPERGQRHLPALALAAMAVLLAWLASHYSQTGALFGGIYHVDLFSNFFRGLFLSAAFLVLLFAARYSARFAPRRSEWYSFLFFACLGMMVMAGAGEMITLYVGLELMTISFYILCAFLLENPRSAEAGLKYLILGALSSAVLLFGLSLVYAVAGSTAYAAVFASLHGPGALAVSPLLLAGTGLVLAGFAFKLAIIPFHMWTPDVYEGAPTPVTAFLSVASKAAGFAALIRLLTAALPPDLWNWNQVLAVLAAVTMVGGNLMALAQTDMKRLLAYSSIAQAGYILVGLIAANDYGLQGVLFYSLVYVFANAGAFAIVSEVEMDAGGTSIQALNGLGDRSPLLAAVMTVCLLSLAGIPPLAGFTGKFYLFAGAIEAGYLWLALTGLLMSMISVYYYLGVSRAMYIGLSSESGPLAVSRPARSAVWICLLLTLALGLYPQPLSWLAGAAVGW